MTQLMNTKCKLRQDGAEVAVETKWTKNREIKEEKEKWRRQKKKIIINPNNIQNSVIGAQTNIGQET